MLCIHETVVATLRKEKENLAIALANQREACNSMAAKVTQMDIRMQDLESRNKQLIGIQEEDKRALI